MIRWQREYDDVVEVKKSCCPGPEDQYKHVNDLVAVRKLETFNEQIFEKLEKRRKAI